MIFHISLFASARRASKLQLSGFSQTNTSLGPNRESQIHGVHPSVACVFPVSTSSFFEAELFVSHTNDPINSCDRCPPFPLDDVLGPRTNAAGAVILGSS